MIRIISKFRIFDDANSTIRIYRPGNEIFGNDAQYALKNGYGEECQEKASSAVSNKSRGAAPENRAAK
jgi:hypothetical protein